MMTFYHGRQPCFLESFLRLFFVHKHVRHVRRRLAHLAGQPSKCKNWKGFKESLKTKRDPSFLTSHLTKHLFHLVALWAAHDVDAWLLAATASVALSLELSKAWTCTRNFGKDQFVQGPRNWHVSPRYLMPRLHEIYYAFDWGKQFLVTCDILFRSCGFWQKQQGCEA